MSYNIAMSDQIIPKRKTIMIFGISSFVGSSLAEFFKKDYRVVGTFFDHPVSIPGVLCLPCDVLAKEEVQLVMFTVKPDYAIYCAGMSSVIDCALDERKADAINTSGLFNVSEFSQRYKAQVIYLSSSFVFAGEDKQYLEVDIPDANTVYGKTLAAAEFYIQKTSLNYLVFRVSKLYGRHILPSSETWFEKCERYLHKKDEMAVDDYVSVGFLDVNYLALIIRICIEKKITNRLFQVSSTDILTHYEFAKTYAEVFGEDSNFISKAKWSYPVTASPATSNAPSDGELVFRLDLSNVEGFLGIKLPTVKESLEFTFRRFKGVSKKGGGRQATKGGGITFI
jgi:dTDP-4-dehydrorhamnose reductase